MRRPARSLTCLSGEFASGTIDCFRPVSAFSYSYATLGGRVTSASPGANPAFASGTNVTINIVDEHPLVGDTFGVYPGATVCASNNGGQSNSLTMGELLVTLIDRDGDRVSDARDNCPNVANFSQQDRDSDGIRERLRLHANWRYRRRRGRRSRRQLPVVANPAADTDGDGQGDACDTDDDGDGVVDAVDNCPLTPNPTADMDGDGQGDACDADDDGDSVLDGADNCPLRQPRPGRRGRRRPGRRLRHRRRRRRRARQRRRTTARAPPTPIQTDTDGDGQGDACDSTPTGNAQCSDSSDNDGGRRDRLPGRPRVHLRHRQHRGPQPVERPNLRQAQGDRVRRQRPDRRRTGFRPAYTGTLRGTAGADVINGTTGADTIWPAAGPTWCARWAARTPSRRGRGGQADRRRGQRQPVGRRRRRHPSGQGGNDALDRWRRR